MANMKYSMTNISVASGTAVFYLVNAEPVPCGFGDCRHNVVITALDKRTVAYSDTVEPGKTKLFTIEEMPKGKYSFHDDIGVHFTELNMSGTLDVI
jgi:plastocyanin